MSALQKWQEALHQVAEGWRQLKDRAEFAMTRFRPDQHAPRNAHDETMWRHGLRWTLMASDISESDNAYELRLEAPGMNRDDFSIDVRGAELTVRGVKRWQNREQKTHYHRLECAYGSFERQFVLPSEIDAQEVRARYRDGILQLHLPKATPNQTRKIAVST
jgi:HSP20 family protein